MDRDSSPSACTGSGPFPREDLPGSNPSPRPWSGLWRMLWLYLLVAAGVTAVWTYTADTENRKHVWTNITLTAAGENYRPFNYRRLVFDSGRVLTHALSPAAWSRISDRIDASGFLNRYLRRALGWSRANDPLLISVSALIAASVLGFMSCASWLVHRLYSIRPLVAHAVSLSLGVGLLGGRGTYHTVWASYAYDFPNAFLFLAGVCAALAGSRLFVPVFLLATYNKETAVLLLPALVLLWPGSTRTRWILAGLLLAAYAVVQLWIRGRFHAVAADWSFIGQNILNVALFSVWRLPLWVLAACAVARHWQAMPRPLRVLLFVPAILIPGAFFKGWVIEYRAYFEAYPFVALMLLQAIARDSGLTRILPPRAAIAPSSSSSLRTSARPPR